MKVAIFSILFVTLLGTSQALDKCPDVKFVDNFDSKRFLGKWYGIETIGKARIIEI
jgi:lipocalin